MDHSNDGDWRCDGSPFQTNTKENQENHADITKHSSQQIKKPSKGQSKKINCNFCDNKFETNKQMMSHRRKNHRTFKPCKNLPHCEYEENCLINHELIDENTFLCYECGEKFNTLSDLMGHRKETHSMINCTKFLKNNCSFTSDKCWYTHKNDAQENDTENLVDMNEQKNEVFENNTKAKAPGFWEAPSNRAPPSDPAPFSQAN
jgi:hypothetical protein